MKKFFNIIPGNGSCCLLLYGEIGGEVRSGDVMRELLEAERNYGRIDVRINSVGGEVYTGIAIFNALRQSKADIHIYIDGIAASMASAIALCGKPVEMSRYARLMIHTVRGGCWGTKKDMADCIEQLESLEGTLCSMYAAKLGQSEEEIRSKYFDGDDHWLSAQEALAQGFVDGIYDVEDTSASRPLSALTDKSTAEEIYSTFNNRLLSEPQTENKMAFLDELKKNPKFKDCTSEEAALQIVAQLTQTAGGAEALAAENASLKKENQAFKDKEAQAFVALKQQLLDDAEKCGKINAVTRPAFAALLESDFEKGKAALEELTPTKRVMVDLAGETGKHESAWDKRKTQIQDRYEQNRYA
ncbi:MAG: Clp protease ClpP [Prevotella sp.]|nr:Clp protease ClpP [Prevotella sp.]